MTRPSFITSLENVGEGQALFEELLDQLPFGVYLDHPDRGCVYANQTLLDQFEMKWSDFKGYGWARILDPRDIERVQAAIHQYELTLEPIYVRYRVILSDKSIRWIYARVHALLGEDGKHIGSLGTTEDVTHQRDFQEKVAHNQRIDAVGRLAGRVAHDFNNILTVLGLSVCAIATKPMDSEVTKSIKVMEDALEQANQLTQQLLTLSDKRISGPTISLLDKELEKMKSLLQRLLGETIEVQLQLNAGFVGVGLDSGSLSQVIVNLATNARDAMSGKGLLEITTSREDDRVEIKVIDQGEGMRQEVLARACEPFFTTKELGRGTGIGLSTVKDLVSLVGGELDLKSSPGQGTTVIVRLPAIDAHVAEVEKPKKEEVTASIPPQSVLLIEDHDGLRQSLAYALALHGHKVATANNVASGKEAIDQAIPDIMVCDIMLPDGSGVSVGEHLRAKAPTVPIIYSSGFVGETDMDKALAQPYTMLLPKPYGPAELLAALNRSACVEA